MKGLGKILVSCLVVTGALLLYVHERVEVLRVSYGIYAKASRLSEQSEEYRRLKFEVGQLRSPENLEKRLKELSLTLTLPKQIQVLRIPQVKTSLGTLPLPSAPPPRSLTQFFGQWIQVAQARTDQ